MFAWLFRKLFRKKGAAAPVAPEIATKAPSRADPIRLIPLVNLAKGRNRQALLRIENLDSEIRQTLLNLECLTNEEIHGPRKRWSDPY